MRKIQQAQLRGKKVIVRCDFNVPIQNGKITEDFKIKESLPTIEFLIKNKAARIVLLAHLGQPDKKDSGFSLEPVAVQLSKLLRLKKPKKTKLVGLVAFQLNSDIFLMENVRFQKEERNNNSGLAKKWASLGQVFIFNGFASAHRDESSITGIAKILPSFAGFLVQKEVDKLTGLLKNPQKPFVLILGGKKTEDKLPVIKNLFGKINTFIVAGETANTFLAAKEISIGKSLYEQNLVGESVKIMKMLLDDPDKDIFIPQDMVVSETKDKPENARTVLRSEVAEDDFIVDIGPKTVKIIEPKIKTAKTIFWNGNLGVTEVEEFSKGSKEVAKIITQSNAESVLAGGNTVAAVDSFGLLDKFSFVSTGGGAALEFLAGKRLTALEALEGSED